MKGLCHMKFKFKKTISIILSVVLFVMIGSVNFVYAANGERSVVDSGNCGLNGDNLKWTLYDDGELVISGEGEMDWYFDDPYDRKGASNLVPWSKYFDRIEVITISEGVTSVGSYALIGENLQYYKVNLPRSLEYFETNNDFMGSLYNEIKKFQTEGKHIAFSYAGTENEWNGVKCKVYEFIYNKKTKELTRELKRESYYNDFIEPESPTTYPKAVNYISLHFNGEEPEDFCEIIKKTSSFAVDRYKKNEMKANYYISDKDSKLVWTIEGDAKFVDGDSKEMTTGPNATIKVTDKATLKLQLVSADGEVVSEDEVKLISHTVTGGVLANAFLSIYLAVFMILNMIVEIF